MKIIIQRAKRKRTEHGFVFNERPIVVSLNKQFPAPQQNNNGPCSPPNCNCKTYKQHLITIPFTKYYSECDKKTNECIPDNALTYEEGSFIEKVNCNECR